MPWMPGGWTRTASTPCPASSGTDNHPRLQQSEGGFEADCEDVAVCRAGGKRGRTWTPAATRPRMTPRTSASSQRQDEDHNQQQEEKGEGEKDLTLGCLTSPVLLLTSSACLPACLPLCAGDQRVLPAVPLLQGRQGGGVCPVRHLPRHRHLRPHAAAGKKTTITM